MVWVRRAADRGHSVAMCKLGMSEKRGDHSAAEWWGRSADGGYPRVFRLWNSYSQGRGVKKDIQRGLCGCAEPRSSDTRLRARHY